MKERGSDNNRREFGWIRRESVDYYIALTSDLKLQEYYSGQEECASCIYVEFVLGGKFSQCLDNLCSLWEPIGRLDLVVGSLS